MEGQLLFLALLDHHTGCIQPELTPLNHLNAHMSHT